ncbi:uncharacterized protein BYT42DRAFT_551090 [Radiomyces spectabilis]|uniref:uncharacterized protein n=1 Tax=Radiomyces spectabilis TaxID=64574 RepID=UPI002220BE8A|nr:uncharacterized protein BYT42DRAFT_551090 [Radiomyces spectabilis]KAI8393455.1 hypothetical protein BYT42DRAFT_551090 [Radiomyces spectabilis]
MQAPPRVQGQAAGQAPAMLPTHQRALIPPTTLDFPTQRLYAISFFVLLQAFKLYDAINVYWTSHPEQYSGVLIKWWIIDVLYIALLWIVKIPWLQFTAFKSIFLAVLLTMLDVAFFVLPSAMLSGVLLKALLGETFGKQISVSRAKMVNVKDVVFNSSHILGRHTVHILPYGTAKLNPNDEFFCIPSNEIGKKDIHIPIVLNNTVPRTISVSRYDFDTETASSKQYSGRNIQRATEIGQGKGGLEYYYIHVKKPGVYKLDNIVSKDGLDVRLYSRQVFVFVCPTVRFKPIAQPDYCLGDKEKLQLEITGVPPLQVEYKRRTGTHPSALLKLDRIQPNDFDSPLVRIPGGLKNADPSFFTPAMHQDYHWAATQQLSIDLDLTFEEAQTYEFELVRVTDGTGNVMDVAESAKQQFFVRPHPTAQFQCSATDPLKLLVGSRSTDLPLKLDGTGPWNVVYEFTPEGGESDKASKETVRLNHAQSILKANAPGEYRLLSVNDNYCKGDIRFPSTCQVIQPPLPVVHVESTPIPSECAGDAEAGMKFVVEFQGTPPFNLEYVITKTVGRSETVIAKKRERIDRARHIFTYMPASSGDYTYKFLSLDDRYYKNQKTDIAPLHQRVHPQPDARFSKSLLDKQAIRTCIGESVNLDVELSGTGPFRLYWTFNKEKFFATVEGNKYTIALPAFEAPNHYVVSLVKIHDANECVKELEARDVIVDVRRDRPTAFFYTEDKEDTVVEIAEGSKARLPLRLTGEGPWRMTYRNKDKDGAGTRSVLLRDPNAEVEVRDAGEYELVSVKDSICRGDVLPPHYIVQWLDKPSVSIVQDQMELRADGVYERAPVCAGVNDAFDIQFQGQGPFYCMYDQYYDMQHRRDLSLMKTEEISSGLRKARVPLETKRSGIYQYHFTKLADQRYPTPFKTKSLVVEQKVHGIPTVGFKKHSKDRVLCVGDTFDSDEMEPIWLEFTGQAPFTINLRVKHQSELHGKIVTLDGIETHKYKLLLSDEIELPGRYDLQLLSVSDGHGCGASVSGPDALTSIDALDIATISPIDSCSELCVGDNIEFSLSGMGPFTVSYTFNHQMEKIKSPSSRLSMLADKPGNLTIVSVGDQRNKCRSFPKGMTKTVHEIPSSLVSGGKEIIENIREGDMVKAVVDLVGTPPFEFVWQRSELIWDHQRKHHYKGKVLESHIVNGVMEHRYEINTSVEGVIEVVSIKDRYCQYPRAH